MPQSAGTIVEPPSGLGLQPVMWPELSRMEGPVRAQMKQRVSSLKTLFGKGDTARADLGVAYGEAGKLLMAASFLDAAETCYLNAQVLSPTDARWPYYLGHLYKAKGPVEKSIASFARAWELMPDDVATMVWLGEAHLAAGHPDVADGVFARAVARDPSSAAAWAGAGRAALATRDYRTAVDRLTRALGLDPRATKIQYSLALAYRGLGDMNGAKAHLAQQGDVEVRPPDPLMRQIDGMLESAEAYNVRGGAELQAGHWEAAASNFRRGLELAPHDPSLRHRLATALFQLGDVSGAMAQFEEVLRTAPDYTQSHYSLALLLSDSSRYAEAIEHFNAALTYQPGYVEARIRLAETLGRVARHEEALAQYTRALDVDPTNTDAALGRAMALVRLHRYEDALRRLGEAHDVHPEHPMFSHALARLLAAAPDDRVRDGRRALSLVDQMMKGEQTIELAETAAMALAEIGRYQEAVDVQRSALIAATTRGLPAVERHIRENLQLYENGRPCRTPFADDELQ